MMHFFLLLISAQVVSSIHESNGSDKYLYVGSYTDRIERYRLSDDLSLQFIGSSESGNNPSWIVFSSCGRFAYAVNEVEHFNGQYSGAVASFRVQSNGNLKLINRVSSGGASPAHIAIDSSDGYLYISNYCSGTIGVIQVIDGVLMEPTQIIDHNTFPVSSCDVINASHVHEVTFTTPSRILVNDLGLNRVYQYDLSRGLLIPETRRIVEVPGSNPGPRHLYVHPFIDIVFVVNELESTLSSYSYNRADGSLEGYLNTISTLREGEDPTYMAAAEIQISSCGDVVYVSNRDISSPSLNLSSIAVFEISDNRQLLLRQHISTYGDQPRHFNLFKSGAILLVANLQTNNIVPFEVNDETGILSPSGDISKMTISPSPTQVIVN